MFATFTFHHAPPEYYASVLEGLLNYLAGEVYPSAGITFGYHGMSVTVEVDLAAADLAWAPNLADVLAIGLNGIDDVTIEPAPRPLAV